MGLVVEEISTRPSEDGWSYEYKMFDQVRRGQLPGSIADADAEVRKIIDQDLQDQFR
jgi:hypothetical protein